MKSHRHRAGRWSIPLGRHENYGRGSLFLRLFDWCRSVHLLVCCLSARERVVMRSVSGWWLVLVVVVAVVAQVLASGTAAGCSWPVVKQTSNAPRATTTIQYGFEWLVVVVVVSSLVGSRASVDSWLRACVGIRYLLNYHGYPVKPNGVWGSDTTSAVIDFQVHWIPSLLLTYTRLAHATY